MIFFGRGDARVFPRHEKVKMTSHKSFFCDQIGDKINLNSEMWQSDREMPFQLSRV